MRKQPAPKRVKKEDVEEAEQQAPVVNSTDNAASDSEGEPNVDNDDEEEEDGGEDDELEGDDEDEEPEGDGNSEEDDEEGVVPGGPPKLSEGLKKVNALYSHLLSSAKISSKVISHGKNPLPTATPTWKKGNAIEAAQANSALYNGKHVLAPSLKPKSAPAPVTAGKGWFDLKPAEMTEELKRDIKLLEMRNYIDPTRFYKSLGKIKNVLHVGTVIEGPTEFRSNRLTNKERKQTIADELLADRTIRDYSKRTYRQIQSGKTKKRKADRKKRK